MRRNDTDRIPSTGESSPLPRGYTRFASHFPRPTMLEYLESLDREKDWLEARAKDVEDRMEEVRDVINRWTLHDWQFLGKEPPIFPEELRREGGAR
jgi:hypothetical protein